MKFKAIITDVSQVTSSGNFEVRFDIYVNDKPAYPNQITFGSSRDMIINNIQVMMKKLLAVSDQQVLFKVGEEIIL